MTVEERAGKLGNLSINPSDVASISHGVDTIANLVRDIYTDIKKVTNEVTMHDSWDDASSKAFVNKFNEADKFFEPSIQSLEGLGPALYEIAGMYTDTEAANAGAIH